MNIAAYPKYESYKPTGVAWSPEAPDHWDIKPVAAVARVTSEANQPDLELLSVYLGQGVIRFSDVEEKRTNATSLDLSKYQVVRPGNLVLNNQQAWRGSVGVSEHTGIVSPAYIVLDLGDAFDGRFADYYFQTSTTVSHFLVSSKGVGTIQRNLYWPALRRCPITIPPLPEQRAIASFLDDKCARIDEAVRIKEAQITLLRERRKILIQQAVTRGLNPDVPMKDSGVDWIGEIPAHWEVKRLKHLGEAIIGLTYDPKDLCGETEGTLVLRSSNLRGGRFAYGESLNVYVNMRIRKKLIMRKDDILICSRNGSRDLIGKCAIATNSDCGASFGAFTTVFRSDINRYIFQILNSEIFRMLAGSFLTSTINQLTTSNLNSIYVPVPPKEERDKITAHLERISGLIERAIAIKGSQIATLKEYRTSLINAAVTGKIKVS